MQSHLREFAHARDKFRRFAVTPAEELIAAASAAVEAERDRVKALESLRPVWAQGFSDDSVAAQSNGNALAEIWKELGVDNQTAAMVRLRELKGAKA